MAFHAVPWGSRSRRNTFVRTEMLKQHIKAKQGAAESSVTGRRLGQLGGAVGCYGGYLARFLIWSPSWRVKRYPAGAKCSENLGGVVLSPYFNLAIIALIIINAALLGIEIDIAFQVGEEDIPTWYATVNKIIVSVFVAEIVLKMVVLG
eukprot:Skav211341  [mRNA]  locus=scaffold2081:9387:11430:+ [translate_table: standard]